MRMPSRNACNRAHPCLTRQAPGPFSQVLSDVEKRKVYDVYGRQGLQAGLELSAKDKTIDELRAQWHDFQAHTRQMRIAMEIAPATRILVKSNAVPLISSINTESGSRFIPLLGVYYEPIWPVVTAGAISHGTNFKLSNSCALQVGGAQL